MNVNAVVMHVIIAGSRVSCITWSKDSNGKHYGMRGMKRKRMVDLSCAFFSELVLQLASL